MALGLCVLWCRVILDACVQIVVLNWVCSCVRKCVSGNVCLVVVLCAVAGFCSWCLSLV